MRQLVERVRRDVRDLHVSPIGIDNAYYCYVAQLLQTATVPIPRLPPIYVVGDSHSLSPSWRAVSWRGSRHLLQPLLVTGLKVWHLRPESDFFTKANFEAAVGRVPDGAAVIFAFGQIDCREGLLVAVQRARYESVQQAIDVAVGLYVTRLLELAALRRFRVLVHQVPPVMEETLAVVTLFNKALRARVDAEPSIEWLDLDGMLVDGRTGKLHEHLELDGTHLHPRYVEMLERSLPP